MTDQKTSYSVELKPDGTIDKLIADNNGSRHEVHRSIENQEFCDFLTSESEQVEGTHDLVSPVQSDWIFIADPGRLLELIERRGMIIYFVCENKETWSLKAVGAQNYRTRSGRICDTVYPLCEAIANKDGIDRENHGGFTFRQTNIYLSPGLANAVEEACKDEESKFRRFSTWPIRRAFVYVDVSDFSKFPPGHQALIINSMIQIISGDDWLDEAPRECEAKLCIGDGYIFVFTSALKATQFAAQFARLTEVLGAKEELPVEFHFRIGIHIGDVYCFWDVGRKDWNYIGDGINGGQRILAAAGKDTDDVIYLSDRVRRDIIKQNTSEAPARDVLDGMINRGRKNDKHDRMWRVYELNPSFSELNPRFQQ